MAEMSWQEEKCKGRPMPSGELMEVSIGILSQVPNCDCRGNWRRRRRGRRRYRHDEQATVFASQDDLAQLEGRGLEEGAVCCLLASLDGLTVGSAVGTQSRIPWAPVILRTLLEDPFYNSFSNSFQHSFKDSFQNGSQNGSRKNCLKNGGGRLRLLIPPCVAATLGLSCFPLSSCPLLALLGRYDTHFPPAETKRVLPASHATVREIGPPPPLPFSLQDNRLDIPLANHSGTHSDMPSKKPLQNDAHLPLRQFFLFPATFKPRQRLLATGSIFATLHRSVVRFYQVIRLGPQPPSQQSWKTLLAYHVSPLTNLTLESSHTLSHVPMPVLPRPSMAASFLQSCSSCKTTFNKFNHQNRASNDNYNQNYSSNINYNQQHHETEFSSSRYSPIHPSSMDVAQLIYLQRLCSINTTNQIKSYKCTHHHHHQSHHVFSYNHLQYPKHFPTISSLGIIHVMGTQDNHHLQQCLTEAADIMGMRCLHVNGLAAFTVQYSNAIQMTTKDAVISSSQRQLTGALVDKLHGLQMALQLAHRSSPCLLHIANIDYELSQDDDTRAEEEQRIMEVIREVIQHNNNNNRNNKSNNRYNTPIMNSTPSIALVISSSKPLAHGPLSRSLEHPSLSLSNINDNYAKYLWDDDASFNLIRHLLRNIPANDILYLRRKFMTQWRQSPTPMNPQSILEPLLQDHLPTIRSISQNPNALQLSTVPNVRWDDVGGLASVRKEIMDVVELPLKYAHLFEGSKRSGILLFGPPGTGKTLVAKAVARECGLPFLSVKGPELLGSYVGESEANVRSTFAAARTAAINYNRNDNSHEPSNGSSTGASVLFFDELDSLAPRRGASGHGDGVMERVVATLLGELDNDEAPNTKPASQIKPHVIVIGATNRPDLLDPALLRPGRFDRLLYLGPAKTKHHCLQILKAQTRKFKFQSLESPSDHTIDSMTSSSSSSSISIILQKAMESFPPTLSGADLSAVASGAFMRGLKRLCDTAALQATLQAQQRRQYDEQLKIDAITNKATNEIKNETSNESSNKATNESTNETSNETTNETSNETTNTPIDPRQDTQNDNQEEYTSMDIDDVIDTWSNEMMQPVITVDDLVHAAREIVPSITPHDLENFELLQKQFCTTME